MYANVSINTAFAVAGLIYDETENVFALIFADKKSSQEVEAKILDNRIFPISEGTLTKATVSFATSFIDTKIRTEGIFTGTQMSIVNHKASAKSASLDKQYFLVDKTLEAPLDDLKKQFFSKNMKKTPIPLKSEWEDFFWDNIICYFKELPSIGEVPYKGYVLTLPPIETLGELVEECHISSEFKERFKRVPKLSALLAIADTAHFDFKSWQTFFNQSAQEKFQKLDKQQQKAVVRAFELLGENETELIFSKAELFHSTGLKHINIMLRLAEDQTQKDRIKRCFKLLTDYYKDDYGSLYSSLANFPDMYKEQSQNILNGNTDALLKFLNQIQYENVSVGAEELAFACSKSQIPKEKFPAYETAYLSHLQDILIAPRAYPTIYRDYEKDYVWETIDMSVPRAWTVGQDTYCCMTPNGPGWNCVLYAAKNPETSFIFRIAQKNVCIAQSFAWLSEADAQGWRTLCFDNIELADKKLMRASIQNAYKDVAQTLKQYYKLFRIKAITIGHRYTDLNLDFCEKRNIDSSDPSYAKIPKSLGYSDADNQSLLIKYNIEEK